VLLGAGALLAVPAIAQDNIEGPWGAPNGNIYAWQRPNQPLGDWRNGMTEAWKFDTIGAGLRRTYYQMAQIVFDANGNLYWLSGATKLASLSPAGALRWVTPLKNDAFGGSHGGSPVVGFDYVYAVAGGNAYDADGDTFPGIVVGAYYKNNGAVKWETEIDPPGFQNAAIGPLSPILYNGKLYVMTNGTGYGLAITRLDAATGAIDWHNVVDATVNYTTAGTMAFVPELFGPGHHGLFFNLDDGIPDWVAGTGLKDVFGIDVGPVGAALAWTAPGGKMARSHLIYSPTTNLLYAHTWRDHEIVQGKGGTSFTVYNPLTGAIIDTLNSGNYGYSDAGMLDFDGKSVIAGDVQGRFIIHVDTNGDGVIDYLKLYKSVRTWFSEPRCFTTLYPANCHGGPYVLTGTSSDTETDVTRTSRVVIHDMSKAMIPSTDDGPMYLDNIRVYAGTDYNDAIAGGAVVNEDFETGFPTIPGPVDQNPNWTDTSGTLCVGVPTVLTDPTSSGQGIVLRLDPYGNENLTGQEMAAQRAFPYPVGSNSVTDTYVVFRWKQWYKHLTENTWVITDTQESTFQWDQDGKIRTSYSWAMEALLTAQVWEDVEVRYDFAADTVELYLNGTPGTGFPDYTNNPALAMNDIEYIFYPTPPVAEDGVIPAEPMAEYNAGGTGNGGRPHQRGGPFRGPDGKIYYFNDSAPYNPFAEYLVALQPVPPSVCRGDLNCDSCIDFKDINPFVLHLSNYNLWLATYPGCNPLNGDINGDGIYGQGSFKDINPFVSLLSSAPLPIPCP
jgi:hypothetical protein